MKSPEQQLLEDMKTEKGLPPASSGSEMPPVKEAKKSESINPPVPMISINMPVNSFNALMGMLNDAKWDGISMAKCADIGVIKTQLEEIAHKYNEQFKGLKTT